MIDEQKQPETSADNIQSPSEGSQEVASDPAMEQQESELFEGGEKDTPEARVYETDVTPGELNTVVEALQLENEGLKQQLGERDRQIDTYKSHSMRIAADFDNFRKRTLKEKEELEYKVKRDTITELLPVVDNFERARSQIKPANDGEMAIHKSYQGVYKNLVDGLKRIGVSAMRAEGQPFDPNYHEAMLRQPTDEYPEDTVMEQLVRGYLIGDRVLRHAMVKVAAPQEPVVTSEEGTSEEDSNLET
ncbi:nucleotide exchange factor GrpE [Lusitaniella coriacea LEGE 07157]|uniref:Protein GrpE n=1 Tax=Lusitaniella coriacea LEGE 07157 TaxID=945747 RepID=A0A8J7B8J3_9CYAN|nr:nucleotide exchange factor GrpE [Lusitaniella coriacea]MBE9114598.1 nucleotide exchange factor GrpE [Lusitaniella coriacea LEGE 07157]